MKILMDAVVDKFLANFGNSCAKVFGFVAQFMPMIISRKGCKEEKTAKNRAKFWILIFFR